MSQLQGKRVLVTGGAGFLGRAMIARLHAAGAEVIATTRSTLPQDAPDGITWAKADLTDAGAITALMADHRPSHLMALAWHMGGGYQQSPENYRWLQHSIDLIFAFAEAGGTRLVFCGSCMEYDWSLEEPFVEGVSALNPNTDYGAAKAALSRIFEPLCARLGVSGAWARPYFLYGPGENPRRLAADVIVSLLEGREALCGAGTQRRDFLHVGDVADAMATLLASDLTGPVNIGSGQAIAMADLITEIGRQIDRPELIKLGARPPRAGEPELVEADPTRLRDGLGWHPTFTLETGVADTIAWWRRELAKG